MIDFQYGEILNQVKNNDLIKTSLINFNEVF